jgi:ubiquinone/menaquinone biosynthesis C-methylase UbiE
LSGAGKRAAFALFYGPLHFLLVERIAEKLCPVQEPPAFVVDLGCGTGAAGAAWAARWSERSAGHSPVRVLGIDRSPWALEEAARTYRHFGLTARLQRGDAAALAWPGDRATLVAAFTINELPGAAREALLVRLLDRASTGNRVLVVEPLARGIAPWWEKARRRFESAGGRADEWRFHVGLPPLVAKLDRASGLDHQELTARTLFAGG